LESGLRVDWCPHMSCSLLNDEDIGSGVNYTRRRHQDQTQADIFDLFALIGLEAARIRKYDFPTPCAPSPPRRTHHPCTSGLGRLGLNAADGHYVETFCTDGPIRVVRNLRALSTKAGSVSKHRQACAPIGCYKPREDLPGPSLARLRERLPSSRRGCVPSLAPPAPA